MEQQPKAPITVDGLNSMMSDLDRAALDMKGLATEYLPQLFSKIKAKGPIFASNLVNNKDKAEKVYFLMKEITDTYHNEVRRKFEELEKEMDL